MRQQQQRRRMAAVVNQGTHYEVLSLDPIPAEPAPFRRVLWRRGGFATYGAALQYASRHEEE